MPYKDLDKRRACNRRYYERGGKALVIAKLAAYRKRNKEYVIALKNGVPCMDCAQVFPYYVMEYDHIHNNKKAEICDLVWSGCSIKTLQIEIDKCELVCSNCHAIRTHLRRTPNG